MSNEPNFLIKEMHLGCTLHFRCGGKYEGVKAFSYDIDGFLISVGHLNLRYTPSGKVCGALTNDHPFDIVKIDPAPFDWKDVKQGMAFKDINQNLNWFIAHDFCEEGNAIFTDQRDCFTSDNLFIDVKSSYTRYPEGDLK